MRVRTLKTPPSPKELAEVLRREFSSDYTYKLYGFGKDKSIMVRKSGLVGVQISTWDKEIDIQRVASLAASSPVLISLFSGLELIYYVWELFFGVAEMSSSPGKKLEKELAMFLKRKYS